jgi:dTDP-4-dehydrorhamnose reductase
MHQADITNDTELQRVFKSVAPDAVIHTAAASQPNFCQQHPDATARINVHASVAIARLCARISSACVFTSTDLVFDGTAPPYRESDPVSPICVYGEQKVEAERAMQREHDQCTVCRMPLMYGCAGNGAPSFIQPLLAKCNRGETLDLFTDEIRTPVSGSDAANGLLLCLTSAPGMALHLGGKERVSRFEFGKMLAACFGYPSKRVLPCKQADVVMPAPRSPDVSLDSTMACTLGYNPAPIKKRLSELAEKYGKGDAVS